LNTKRFIKNNLKTPTKISAAQSNDFFLKLL
jgi:hypothetical protein